MRAGVWCVMAGVLAPAVAVPAGVSGERWTFHHEGVLGTSLEMTVGAADRVTAERAEAAVLARMDADEAVLSTWRADSEVSRWAGTRFVPERVSAELLEVLGLYDMWRERTDGALDASVGAATRLWERASAEGRVPTEAELRMAVEAMQQAHWSVDRERGTATRLTDVPLLFGTFTKSYISERAAQAALRAGATAVMLNVGGDVVVRGDLLQAVGVADPRAAADNGPALEHVVVRDRAVATSGGYKRQIAVAGERYSHLLDPRSGRPVGHVLQSTVVARDAVTAGALATAVSVLPVREGRRLLAATPGAEWLLVLADGTEERSAGWPGAPGLRRAMYAPAGDAAAADFVLDIDLQLPRIEDARYRRPYVAVWVEDADRLPVRTVALWTQNPRWLPELKQWYREDQVRTMAEGTDVSRTVSSATRPPGSYKLRWDGKDDQGKAVKPGRYTVVVEASREHGGYQVERHEVEVHGGPQQATLPAGKELGAVVLDYHKRG